MRRAIGLVLLLIALVGFSLLIRQITTATSVLHEDGRYIPIGNAPNVDALEIGQLRGSLTWTEGGCLAVESDDSHVVLLMAPVSTRIHGDGIVDFPGLQGAQAGDEVILTGGLLTQGSVPHDLPRDCSKQHFYSFWAIELASEITR